MAGTGAGTGHALRRRRGGLTILALLAVGACQADAPTGSRTLGDFSLAKGGGGSTGGGGSAPTVTAADPAFAVRDTTLDVIIAGSGFTTGAKATWALAGDTSLVHVKSTKVVSSEKLIVRIEVPADAPLASYDIQVTLTNGKKGVGAELFEVLRDDPTAELFFPLDETGLDVRSDHQFTSGASSVYADGVCGVNSKIFATEAQSNSGDATMGTDNPKSKARTCAAYPRTLTVVFGPGDEVQSTVFMNLRHIQNTTFSIPIGSTSQHNLHLNEARCDGLRWVTVLADGTVLGGDPVNVTRVDASTWLVESRPYPDNKAYCVNTGQLLHLNVRFTIVSSYPLP